MKKIKCLVVDDEAPARRIIEGFIEKTEEAELIGSVKNALEAKSIIDKKVIDVVFLDINMPEISGIELLKMIEVPPVVVLTTAYAEYGAESYEYEVTDYLLKPIRFERFNKAFLKVKQVLNNQSITTESKFTQEYFEFKADRELKRILLKDIFYIRSLGNYIKVVTKNKAYLTILTTNEAEGMLRGSDFIRIHKSIIVNIAAITSYTSDSVALNDTSLTIGKTFRKYTIEQLSKVMPKR